MIVMKFGGTSVQNAHFMDKALDIAQVRLSGTVVLVSSAMSKITDSLIAITNAAEAGDEETAMSLVEAMQERHISTARDFLTGENLEECEKSLITRFTRLSSLVKGLTLLRECSDRSRDALMAFGELFSTTLLYYRALERGMDAIFLDSRQMVITDGNFTEAYPIFELTNKRIREAVEVKPGRLYIAQGFIGSTEEGATTTLGRGGSDFTATIYGAALDAEEVQIWTDVNGIMTTDPRIVKNAITVPRITYDEAAELAYFGAKVVHPSTIRPAVLEKIPVSVRNTADAAGICTTITEEAPGEGIRAIAGKKNITLINVTSSKMLNAYGFLSAIFRVFEHHETSVDLVATSEVTVSMTIENTDSIDMIVKDLEALGDVKVETDKAIICLVGLNLWRDSAFTARVFSSIQDIPVRMISLGSSDINLSLVVPQDMIEESILRLHGEFFS
ncbi:MAG: aspartate kinase [Spirochaetales bacterium]|nr:aspartate kinase [Spirochaetales bacterium]